MHDVTNMMCGSACGCGRWAAGAAWERGGSAAAVRLRAAARTSLVTDRAGELARLRAFARMRRSAARGSRGRARGAAGAGRERDGRVVKRRGERRGRVAARGGARQCVAAYRDAAGTHDGPVRGSRLRREHSTAPQHNMPPEHNNNTTRAGPETRPPGICPFLPGEGERLAVGVVTVAMGYFTGSRFPKIYQRAYFWESGEPEPQPGRHGPPGPPVSALFDVMLLNAYTIMIAQENVSWKCWTSDATMRHPSSCEHRHHGNSQAMTAGRRRRPHVGTSPTAGLIGPGFIDGGRPCAALTGRRCL